MRPLVLCFDSSRLHQRITTLVTLRLLLTGHNCIDGFGES